MALEIFRLVGSVFVDTDEANKSLQKSDDNANKFGKTLLNGVTTAAKWAAGLTAAAGAVATLAVKSYAEYEQLVGGVETLFKDSANQVIKNAETAYKTAGITASDYMNTVTSFAASLLQSLGNDTAAAAKYADMAITDMSDNANKMGSSMESIQTAYQGFAKGQYQLLDNLKLGYGGTKTEMLRLLADADAINAKQGVLTKYSLDNLSDVYEAIHVVQGELGIAGATALEATTTIEGGINLIKAKLSDLFTKIGGAFAPVAQHLIGVVIEGLPVIESMVNSLLPIVVAGADSVVSWLDRTIYAFQTLIVWIGENSDKIIEWTGYIVAASVAVGAFLIYLNWGTIMSTAAGALQLVTTAVTKLNTTIKANPIGLLISLIVSLIAYMGYLYATNEEFRAFVDEMMSALWAKLQVVFAWIEANVLPIIQQIVEWAKSNLLPFVYEFVAWMQNTLLPEIQRLVAWIAENIPPVILMIISWVQTNLLPVIQSVIAWLRTNIPPIFEMVVEWVQTKLVPTLQSMIAWLQANVIPIVIAIAGWIMDTLVPAIGAIITWVKDHLLPIVLNVISWITETIGSFFSWFIGIFRSTSDSAGGIWETIKNFFKSAWDFIVGIWEACKPFFDGVWNGVIMPVAGMIGEMIGAFKMAWDVIKLVWDYVKPYFEGLWEAIKAAAQILCTVLGTFFKNAWEVIKAVWSVVSAYFAVIWEAIKAVFSVVATYLGGFFRTAWEAIKAVWDVVISYFTMVWAGIKAVFAVVKGVLSGDFSDAWEAIKNLWDKAKAFFQSVWNGIKNVFSSCGSWFGDTFKAAWNAVKKVFSSWGAFFSGLWDTITDTFSAIGTNISNAISKSVKAGLNGVISSIEGIINSGVSMINGAIRIINKIPGVSVGSLSYLSLPRLARGGVVNEPTVAEIGEDGAEAVVPLERNTGWIDRLSEKVAQSIVVQAGQGNSNISLDKVLDKMDELLDALQANQTITLNKREFARIVKEVG